jgi:hypothetical protein
MEGYGGIWSRIWWCGYGAPILDGKQALRKKKIVRIAVP